MTRAQPLSILAVKVFVEGDQVFPEWIERELIDRTMNRSAPRCIGQKNPRQTTRYLVRHLFEIHHLAGTGRAFDEKIFAVKMMVPLECLDDQKVHRKPYRAAPIGISTEHPVG